MTRKKPVYFPVCSSHANIERLFLFLTVTDVNPATMPPPSNHSFPSPGPPATPPSPPLQTTNQNPSSTKFPGGTKPTLPTIPNPPAYTGPSKAGEYEASHLWNLINDMKVKILIFFCIFYSISVGKDIGTWYQYM